MSAAKGQFISFEGGEGAGKTTQIKRLAQALKTRGLEVVTTREPGGTPNAEAVRDLVMNGDVARWSATEEMLLMYTARSELVRTVIKPALRRGAWVLSDRFADSTTVYQGYAGGVPVASVLALHKLVLGDFQPDLTLIFDIDPKLGLSRVARRAEVSNRFEEQDLAYYDKLRRGYLEIARQHPKRCAVLDAAQSADDLFQHIVKTINARTTAGVVNG